MLTSSQDSQNKQIWHQPLLVATQIKGFVSHMENTRWSNQVLGSPRICRSNCNSTAAMKRRISFMAKAWFTVSIDDKSASMQSKSQWVGFTFPKQF